MIETMSVSLSVPALSFLLYENLKSTYGQEGFLLGQIVQKETSSITDNDQRQVHVARIVKVNSCVPCPQMCYFYDGIGRVDQEKIKNFLGDLASKVIAWYKYKPSSSFNLTFREKVVHKQLANLFDVPPEFFTCCLLISESSDNRSTHSFIQNFIRYHNHNYEELPVHIGNLSDSNNMFKSAEPVSETFSSILKNLKIDHKTSQGLTIVTKIQNALQKHTNHIVQELSEAEKRLFELESEVQDMKVAIRKKQLLNAFDRTDEHEQQSTGELSPNFNSVNSLSSDVTSTPKSVRGKTVTARRRPTQTPTKRNNSDAQIQANTSMRLRKRN